jgi:hypothetical protein
MVSLEYGPGRASTEPKHLGLLIECEESLEDESVTQFPDLACLSRLYRGRSQIALARRGCSHVDCRRRHDACLFPLAGAPATTNIIAEPPRL